MDQSEKLAKIDFTSTRSRLISCSSKQH